MSALFRLAAAGCLVAIASAVGPAPSPTFSLGELKSLTCAGATCTATVATAAAEPSPRCAADSDVVCSAPVAGLSAAPPPPATMTARLEFWSPSIVRYWLSTNFTDNAMIGDNFWRDPIIGKPSASVTLGKPVDKGTHWEVACSQAGGVTVQLTKSPMKLSVLAGSGAAAKPVFSESAPLSWNSSSVWQTLSKDAAGASLEATGGSEYFYGGGMQNGRWSHRGRAITGESCSSLCAPLSAFSGLCCL